jgi:hypothetical protein
MPRLIYSEPPVFLLLQSKLARQLNTAAVVENVTRCRVNDNSFGGLQLQDTIHGDQMSAKKYN